MEGSSSSRSDYVNPKAELYDAISKGEWDDVERLFGGENKLKALAARLTESGETALLVAIRKKRGFSFVQKLIDLMPPELLELTDYNGNTAAHAAEDIEDGEIVRLLVDRNHRLQYFWNSHRQQVIPPIRYEQDFSSWSDELIKAVKDGDWNSMERLVRMYSIINVLTERLPPSGNPALDLAIRERRNIEFIRKMVDWIMPRELLALTDYSGYTALHYAAFVGYEEAAKLLAEKMPELLNFYNVQRYLPIQVACVQGYFKIAENLLNVSMNNNNNSIILLQHEAGARAMQCLVLAGFYDLALKLFKRKPELALDESINGGLRIGSSLLVIAEDHTAFPSGTFFTSIWDSFLYSCYPKMPSKIRKVLEFLELPSIKNIREANLKHHDAIKLVQSICEHIKQNIQSDRWAWLLRKIFLTAAQNGIQEIVTEILNSFPNALDFRDDYNCRSIFHFAVMYRDERIFNIARQKSTEVYDRKFLLSSIDENGNSLLHLAGKKACQDRLDLKPQPILQMQSEVKWFKEIENLSTPATIKSVNHYNETPLTLFNKEHADLARNEIQWVTSMASACSVAASLIATVAFTSAITVPGGNEDSNGLPIFSNRSFFLVFAVSDAFALFASITSVVTFLSIFTSRYGVNDFLYQLPNRLIIGLISLFLSVISLMIAFGSTLFLLFAKKNPLILIPITTFSCVPVIFYAFLQLPPLINMMKSTYGPDLLRHT